VDGHATGKTGIKDTNQQLFANWFFSLMVSLKNEIWKIGSKPAERGELGEWAIALG